MYIQKIIRKETRFSSAWDHPNCVRENRVMLYVMKIIISGNNTAVKQYFSNLSITCNFRMKNRLSCMLMNNSLLCTVMISVHTTWWSLYDSCVYSTSLLNMMLLQCMKIFLAKICLCHLWSEIHCWIIKEMSVYILDFSVKKNSNDLREWQHFIYQEYKKAQ